MKILSILFLGFFTTLSAQLTENFEEGHINRWEQFPDQHWNADEYNSLSGIYSLHHIFNDSTEGSSQISLCHNPLLFENSFTQWQFSIRHGYAPSSSNKWAVFFVSGKSARYSVPYGDANGYVLGVNFTGNDDTLKVWKQSDGKVTCLFKSLLNWQIEIGTETTACLQISRNPAGIFELRLDTTPQKTFPVYLGSFTDTSFSGSDYFSIYYKYTSMQDQKLWFDDLSISGNFIPDVKPPVFVRAWFSGKNSIKVEMTESLKNKAEITPLLTDLMDNRISDYEFSGNILTVYYQLDFQNKSRYSFMIEKISDAYGNEADPFTIDLVYYLPQFNDVVITEIMADPDQKNNLPEVEYVELYNRTDYTIYVENWKSVPEIHVEPFPWRRFIRGSTLY
ncbi:MAG: lamin tail domain-containing protein [Bacteroidales bacterium]|nr:lamin tail domain-containing protein [Bacteroidales bacterium]